MKHTCCWVLADGTYCGKPTSYRITRDDDGNKTRKYDTFCNEHRDDAEKQKQQEEDECY